MCQKSRSLVQNQSVTWWLRSDVVSPCCLLILGYFFDADDDWRRMPKKCPPSERVAERASPERPCHGDRRRRELVAGTSSKGPCQKDLVKGRWGPRARKRVSRTLSRESRDTDLVFGTSSSKGLCHSDPVKGPSGWELLPEGPRDRDLSKGPSRRTVSRGPRSQEPCDGARGQRDLATGPPFRETCLQDTVTGTLP
jgi:hypothetical protein